jgi:hypothetical protein
MNYKIYSILLILILVSCSGNKPIPQNILEETTCINGILHYNHKGLANENIRIPINYQENPSRYIYLTDC